MSSTGVGIQPGARLRDAVAWQVQRPTLASVTLTGLLGLLVAAPLVVLSGGADPGLSFGPSGVARSLPMDPEAPVKLGDVFIEGRAPWLSRQWDASPQQVYANQRAAWTNTSALESGRRDLPLDRLRITAAHPGSLFTNEKTWRSSWQLELTDGEHDVRLLGRWLGLAYLGTLAGWPEPADSA